MYQSEILLDYHARSVDVELQLPLSRLQQVFGQPLSAAGLKAQQSSLTPYIVQRMHAHAPDGAGWLVEAAGPLVWTDIDGAPYIVAHLTLLPVAGGSVRQLTLEDDVITDSLPTHAVLVTVRSDWNSSTFANDPELVGIITGNNRLIAIDRAAGHWSSGFGSIFHLGVRHIAEGTDHLLFLLALLLPAPLLVKQTRWAGFAGIRHGFTQILKVVTAFTIGHSITLALAASGLVNVPGHPIEILIAVSILISAIHAIRPIFPGREAWIAGGFGLIHGLAFASTLAELGLHRWERVASIFGFNLGIEAMQLLVVLCVMPSLMLLSRTRLYTAFRITGAALAGLAAGGWVLERSFGLPLHVDTVVDGLAAHPVALALILFAVSLGATFTKPLLKTAES